MHAKAQHYFTTSGLVKAGLMAAFCLCYNLSLAQKTAALDTTHKLKQVDISSATTATSQTITPTQQVSQTDFARDNAYNVTDAIRDFAGVNVKDYGGIGGVKTVSVRSLGADNTAVLYNGIQITDAQNGQIDLSRYNLDNIRSIALYNAQPTDIVQTARAFASASVLSIHTLVPELSADKPYQFTFGVKAGSFGLVNPYLQWRQRISQRWALVVNTSEEYANGAYRYHIPVSATRDSAATRRNDGINAQQLDAGLYWMGADSSRFNLQLNYYHADRELPGAVIPYSSQPNQYLHTRDVFVQAGYAHSMGKWQLLLNSKAGRSYNDYFDAVFFNSQGYLDESYTQKEFYQSVTVAYRLLPWWKLSFASDADILSLNADDLGAVSPTRLNLFEVLATDMSLGRLHLQANLLDTYIRDHVLTGTVAAPKNAVIPTIMSSIQPFRNTQLLFRAFYKSVFRYPTFTEQYYYAFVPRSLRPEQSKQYNLGVAYTLNSVGAFDLITLSADAYYNVVKDKIIYVPTQSPDVPSFINLGNVDITGVDVNLKTRIKLSGNWNLPVSGSYTYQYAVDVTDKSYPYYQDQIPYTPLHTATINAGISYNQAGLYYNWVISSSRYSASDNVPANYLPGYAISDITLTYQWKQRNMPVKAGLGIHNLFDKNYVVVTDYPMPGRSFRINLQISI